MIKINTFLKNQCSPDDPLNQTRQIPQTGYGKSWRDTKRLVLSWTESRL